MGATSTCYIYINIRWATSVRKWVNMGDRHFNHFKYLNYSKDVVFTQTLVYRFIGTAVYRFTNFTAILKWPQFTVNFLLAVAYAA